MGKYEIALAAKTLDDLESGHKRVNEGDIIAIKPYPWNWGRKEVKQCLIIIVDGLTDEEVELLKQPLYNGGLSPEQVAIQEENNVPVDIIAKRRYNIPLDIIKQGWQPDLDKTKVNDWDEEYQPVKDGVETLIDMNEKVAICKDTFLDSFKYSTEKVI